MKGFFVASAGTLIGSAVAFSVLRWLFSARLRKWVATNEKWQALESVVVSELFMHTIVTIYHVALEGQGLVSHSPHPRIALPSMGVF